MKEPRLHFWGTRYVNTWNNLPDSTRTAGSVNVFKESYNKWVSSNTVDRETRMTK